MMGKTLMSGRLLILVVFIIPLLLHRRMEFNVLVVVMAIMIKRVLGLRAKALLRKVCSL